MKVIGNLSYIKLNVADRPASSHLMSGSCQPQNTPRLHFPGQSQEPDQERRNTLQIGDERGERRVERQRQRPRAGQGTPTNVFFVGEFLSGKRNSVDLNGQKTF